MKKINTEEILRKLEGQLKEHQSNSQEVQKLLEQQTEIIKSLLEELKPIYMWYKQNRISFLHPRIKVRSSSGPVLGYDEENYRAYIFNVDKNSIERINLDNTEESKNIPVWRLVEEGYFLDAYNGLMYLEKMMERYIHEGKESISSLLTDIKSI